MPVTYPPMIVMGAQGTGKSTIGAALAARLNIAFIDGDDLHPPANKQKMAGGTPLTDEDRDDADQHSSGAEWAAAENPSRKPRARSALGYCSTRAQTAAP